MDMSFNVNGLGNAMFSAGKMAVSDIIAETRARTKKAAGGNVTPGGATIGSLAEVAGEKTQNMADNLQAAVAGLPDDASFKQIQQVQARSQVFQSASSTLMDAIKNAGQVAQKAGSKN
jgi:uncharacterized protein YukE